MMGVTEWNDQQLMAKYMNTVETRMNKAMQFVAGDVKKSVNRGNRSGKNPSLAGEPPKKVTGTLQNNIASTVQRSGNAIVGAVGVRRGPANEYAPRLELGFTGTDSKGRRYNQKPRPYLVPAIARNREKILRTIRKG